jgi:hypothetical protein
MTSQFWLQQSRSPPHDAPALPQVEPLLDELELLEPELVLPLLELLVPLPVQFSQKPFPQFVESFAHDESSGLQHALSLFFVPLHLHEPLTHR